MKLIVPQRRLITRRRALIGGAASIIMMPYVARAQLTLTGAGKKPGGGGGGFTGPGDVATAQGIAQAWSWGGFRAYSAAVAATGTQKCLTIDNPSLSSPTDILILTSGYADDAAISTAVAGYGGAGVITRIWDQTGNARHFNITGANHQFTCPLMANAIGTHWGGRFDTAVAAIPALQTAGTVGALPQSLSYVIYAESGGSSQICGAAGGSMSAGVGYLYNGNTLGGPVGFGPNDAWIAQVTLASTTNVNSEVFQNGGSGGAGDAGTSSPSGFPITIGSDAFGNYANKNRILEFGIWNGLLFTTTNANAFMTNSRSASSGWNF